MEKPDDFGKVQLFWEGHKDLHNLPRGLDTYLENVQTMRKIMQNFVAFSKGFIYLRSFKDSATIYFSEQNSHW